jgi:hypothetical protein
VSLTSPPFSSSLSVCISSLLFKLLQVWQNWSANKQGETSVWALERGTETLSYGMLGNTASVSKICSFHGDQAPKRLLVTLVPGDNIRKGAADRSRTFRRGTAGLKIWELRSLMRWDSQILRLLLRRLITVLTRLGHWSFSWAQSI